MPMLILDGSPRISATSLISAIGSAANWKTLIHEPSVSRMQKQMISRIRLTGHPMSFRTLRESNRASCSLSKRFLAICRATEHMQEVFRQLRKAKRSTTNC